MPVSPQVAALLLLPPAIVAICLVKRWFAPRGLAAEAYVSLPIAGVVVTLLAAIVELAVHPLNLKQRPEHIALLSAIAAFVEESAKTLVLVRVLRRRRGTLSDTASVVTVGVLIGLGCSLFENITWTVSAAFEPFSLLGCVGRAFLATPGHAAYTGLVAWMVARKRIEHRRFGGLALGFVLATLLHFTYDALGLSPQLAGHAIPVEVACRSAQALLIYGTLARIFWRARTGSEARNVLTPVHAS
jgi:RsiW-degrading membrane proteinase PrsW (M82 family)